MKEKDTAFLIGEGGGLQKNLRADLSDCPASERTPLSAVRVSEQERGNITIERMSTISTSMADSTDTRVSELIEAVYSNNRLSDEAQSLTCMSSSVRNFGHVGTLGINSTGEAAGFKDCTILAGSVAEKQFCDRDYVKCDSVTWEDLLNVQRTNVAPSENVTRASFNLSSINGACKFIKDEQEPSVIMGTPSPNFDQSAELPALDSCCDSDTKQQLGFRDEEQAAFTPGASGSRPGLGGSPNFLIDLNQAGQLPALGQGRVDSRCSLPGKAVIQFDGNTHASTQVTMFKSEVPRWQMQASPPEPQFWCQPPGETEDPFTHSGYDVIQSQALVQRNSPPFSTFPG